MSVAAEATQEELHLLVDHGVVGHGFDELCFFVSVWQFAFQQQIAGFEVVALGGELLDGVATIEQFTLVAVDVGDTRLARRSGQEARVIGEFAGFGIQRTDIDHVRTHRAAQNWKIDRRRAVGEGKGCELLCHGNSPLILELRTNDYTSIGRH